jgi:uncharacterized membrane protein
MFNRFKPKDIAVLLLTLTLCTILTIYAISTAFLEHDTSGRAEEIIAFLLGSITTIVGEYILLHLKNGGNDDNDE